MPANLPPEIEAKLESVRPSGDGWIAKCVVHDDGRPSLSIRVAPDGKLLVNCFAGCDPRVILDKLGYEPPAKTDDRTWTPRGDAVAVYDYRDEAGKLLFQVLRTAEKEFPQRVPDPSAKSGWRWKLGDTRRVLFRLPELVKGVAAGQRIWIVEGEKDALALVGRGEVATCNPGGAGKWRPEYAEVFRGAVVTVWQDGDDTGRKHGAQVAESLAGVAVAVRVVEAAEGHKDAASHLGAGVSLADVRVIGTDDFSAAEAPQDRRGIVDAEQLFTDVIYVAEHGLGDSVIDFGWSDLDYFVKARAGNFVVVGARPGVGKSVFVAHVARHNALAGRSVLVVSLEMTALEYGQMQMAAYARIGRLALSEATMEERDWERAGKALPELVAMHQKVVDQPSMTLVDIADLAEEHKPALIAVDYLQLLKPASNESRQIAVSGVAQGLKELAKQTGSVVLAAAQLNRAGENRQNKKPLLSDLRESGGIEQAADTVLLLHREEMYEHESVHAGELDVLVPKQRNGQSGGSVTLGFQGAQARIVQLAPDYQRSFEGVFRGEQ